MDPAITFSGIASGIDGEAVTRALLERQRLTAVPFENKQTANEKESTALEKFNSKLLALDDVVKGFRTLSGEAISRSASSSNQDALSVVIGQGAGIGTNSITIENLAKSGTISFSDRFAGKDSLLVPELVNPVLVEFTIGTAESAETFSIELSKESSLSDFVNLINEVTEGKLRASAVNVASESAPEYVLSVRGVETGADKGHLELRIPSELEDAGSLTAFEIEQAEDARFVVSGLGQIIKPSNQVSDIIPGVTFELKQETSIPVILSVQDDPVKTAKKFADVVSAMNELIKFSRDESKIEREETENGSRNIFKDLARTRTDNQAVNAIRETLVNLRTTAGSGEVSVFADLGLKIEREGTYAFDEQIFTQAASADPLATEQLLKGLADKLAAAGGIINQYSGFQGQIELAQQANEEENKRISERLERLEHNLAQREETLRRVFANLESTFGRLNSASQAINSLLLGLET